jgi:hypothetical protein
MWYGHLCTLGKNIISTTKNVIVGAKTIKFHPLMDAINIG